MSVYSISNRGADQSAAPAASSNKPAQPVTAEMAFANALRSSFNFSSLGIVPSVTVALKESLDRPLPKPVADKPAAQNDQPAPQQAAPASKRADNTADDNQPAPQQAAPAPASNDKPAQAARPSDDGGRKVAANDYTTRANAKEAADADAQAAQEQVVATVLPVVQQQQVTVDTTQDDETSAAASSDQDPFAWLDKAHGDKIAQLANQIAAPTADDGDTQSFGDVLAQAQAGGKHGDMHDIAQKDQTSDELAGQQADDLAAKLAGTGANLKVNVKVDDSAQKAQDQDAAADATATVDPILLAQGGDAQAAQQNQNSDGSNTHGADDDAQAAAAQAAAQAADAAAEDASNTKVFSAALAAHVEAAHPADQPQSGSQQTMAVGAATAAQAADKTAAARAPQAPRAPQMPHEAEVVDQVKVQIDKGVKEGADTIKVQLKPVELGRIEIKLEVSQDGTVSATVTADNKNTLAMLQKDADGLAKSLSDAGLRADTGSLNFNLRGEQQNAGQNDSQSGRSRRRRTLSGVDLSGGDGLGPVPQPRFMARSGVNIQV